MPALHRLRCLRPRPARAARSAAGRLWPAALAILLAGTTVPLAVPPAGAAGSRPETPLVTQVWLTNPDSMTVATTWSSSLAAKFFNRTASYEWAGAIPEGWVTTPYVNYGSFARFEADLDAGNAPDVPVLMYDPEPWWRTPLVEQQHPIDYMKQFAALAHDHGYRVINAPFVGLVTVSGGACVAGEGEDIWAAYIRCKFPSAAATNADGYDIQVQQWQCSQVAWPSQHRALPSIVGLYSSRVQQAAAQARAANGSIEVYSGLSTGWCSPTGDDLYAAWQSVRSTVTGHFIHLPPIPKTGMDFFGLVAPVIVGDAAFDPVDFAAAQSMTVTWRVGYVDTMVHSVVDPSGMGLFNTGVRHSGYVFRYTFTGAGTYAVLDDQTSHRSTVSIPAIATPATGGTGTTFTVQASTAAAPTGFVWDTYVKRPGDAGFVFWKNGYSNSFAPDRGAGVYEFHSRLRRKVNGAAAGWSPSASITVS